MKNVWIAILALTFFACGEDKGAEDKENLGVLGQNLANLPAQLAQIDSAKMSTWSEGSSLNYSKLDGLVSIGVKMYFDGKNVEKYVENFTEQGKGGMRAYYLKDAKIFAIYELYEENSNPEKAYMVERYSLVANDKVTECTERVADFETDLINKSFQKSEVKSIDIARMIRAINQKGEFATTFQGFLDQGGVVYMLVGEPKPGKDAFTSALQVDMRDQLIHDLMSDPDIYINRKVRVEYESMTDPNSGFTAQLYLHGDFI